MRKLLLNLPAPVRRLLGYVLYHAAGLWVSAKWWAFGKYYVYLQLQAAYLYRTSDLYRSRWLEMGTEFAELHYETDKECFFNKARKSPWGVRWRIFRDATFGREPVIYVLHE